VNDGVLIIEGDANAAILADVNDGYIRAAVDKNSVMVDYNNINPGRTTVWAAPHFELVPDVVGLDRGAVQSVLSQSGFAVGMVVEEYNDVIAADEVMGQDPNAGDVLEMGSAVNLLVSLGQPIVPDVRGMSLADANTAIEAVDQLTVGLVTYGYSNTVAAGDVISQLPESGVRVPIGSSIDLVISLGMPIVPFVTGEAEADAITGVEHVYSLSSTISYEYHNEVAAGFVSGQDPVGGTPVPIGSVVSLVVSLGQPIVPDLIGMTEGEAAVALEPVLLVVGSVGFEYSNSVATGLVMSQSPVSGTAVPIGSGINLSVSLGRPSVPEVVGLELSAATVAVEDIDNLVVDDVVLQYSDSVSSDVVISQDPVGSSLVLIGSGVELTVSLGPPVVANVVGQSEGAAVSAIEAVDSLTTSVSYEYHNDVAEGDVISQDPVGGTSVLIGSVVNLVVSRGRPVVPVLTGMTEGEAASALGEVLLVVGSVGFEYSNSVATGLVMSQSPVSGTSLVIGSGVDLTVSLGRPEVPDVVGLELSAATVAVEGVGSIVVGDVVWEYSNVVPWGFVIGQSPVGGSLVLIGTPVELTVSLGRPVVPDVVGQGEAVAVDEIVSIDSLEVSLSYEYHNDIAGGIVISQVPVGGIEVDIGSNVDLVVSLDRPVVLDVVGMIESEAVEAIEAVDNLSVSVGYDYDNVVGAGSVVSQVPVGGASVEIGSEVGIVVSLGRPVVVDVDGLFESAAVSAIEAVDNLGTMLTYEYDNEVAAGDVISQVPVGGTAVDIGTVVSLVVSRGRPVVPLVIEMVESEAVEAIEAVDNLQASVSYDYHDSIAAGSVMAQYPFEGTVVTIGTTVNVIVSLGRPVVPDVVGQSRTDAILAIRGVGRYYAEVHYVYHESVLADIVISQDPVGGVDANVGTVVALEVSAGVASEMVLGGYRLVELQNNDGGWDSPLSDGNPYAGSDPYGFTWAAIGLSQAYLFSRQNDDPNLRAGLERASSYLLNNEHDFTVGDGYLAIELDRVFGGTVHKDHVKRTFYDKLAAGTYADSRSGEFDIDTSEYVDIIRSFYGVYFENLSVWELGVGVYSARIMGVDTSEWVAGLKEEIRFLRCIGSCRCGSWFVECR
jgi:beta-lactam-binding protein with PASTA domain